MSFIKGRVTKDAEVKTGESGKNVVNFFVAVTKGSNSSYSGFKTHGQPWHFT